MPIPVEKLVYDTERKLNSLNSGRGEDYRVVDLIAAINEAYEVWFENKVYAADTNQKIRNDLRQFEIKKKRLPCEKIDCNCCKAKYPDNFYQLLNQTAHACNECCEDEKEIIISMVQGDDLQPARKNPYRRGDFFWEQLLGDEAQDGLFVYHEGGMEVKEVCIDYFRKITHVQAPNLVKCRDGQYRESDGKVINQKVDFEIDATYANREVTDIAALIKARDTLDLDNYQTQFQKTLNFNKFHRL